jgi:hypothetical protein
MGYGGMGGMGGYNPFGGMGYGSSMMGGYGQSMGGGYGSMYGSTYSNPYASSYGSTYNPFGSSSYGMSYDPYMSMGFGGGYQQPSSYNPFSGGGFGTTFGGMGGYNQMGGYGQVGLGYLPPPQQTINDTVANQFMQQYYGGAFGLGAQPQPRRQRPRNPFRREQPLPQVQPQMDVSADIDLPKNVAFPIYGSPARSSATPVGVFPQALPYAESVVNPIQYDAAPLPTSFFSPGAFNSSLLNDLNYMRF